MFLEFCIFLIAPVGFVYGILLFILVHLGIDNFIFIQAKRIQSAVLNQFLQVFRAWVFQAFIIRQNSDVITG